MVIWDAIERVTDNDSDKSEGVYKVTDVHLSSKLGKSEIRKVVVLLKQG